MDSKLKKVLKKKKWTVVAMVILCSMFSYILICYMGNCIASQGRINEGLVLVLAPLFLSILIDHLDLGLFLSQLKLLFFELILIMCMVIFFLVIHSLAIAPHDFIQV